jgi:hypothetical protein
VNKVREKRRLGDVGWDYLPRWENLHGSMVLLVVGARVLEYMDEYIRERL